MSDSKQARFYDKQQKRWTDEFLKQQRKYNCKSIIFTNDENYIINQPPENLNHLIYFNDKVSKDVTILLYTQNNLQLNNGTNVEPSKFKQFINDRKSSYADEINCMDYLLFDSMLIHMNWIESVIIRDTNIDIKQSRFGEFRNNLSTYVNFNDDNNDGNNEKKKDDEDTEMEKNNENINEVGSVNTHESTDSDMNPNTYLQSPNDILSKQQDQNQQQIGTQNEKKSNESNSPTPNKHNTNTNPPADKQQRQPTIIEVLGARSDKMVSHFNTNDITNQPELPNLQPNPNPGRRLEIFYSSTFGFEKYKFYNPEIKEFSINIITKL